MSIIQKVSGIKSKYFDTWADEYDREVTALKHSLDKKEITQKQFEKKNLELKISYAAKFASYYAGLAANMVSSMQEYEISASDAKYDELIRQAENNGEDTAALEEEKENKKLEIQKKYADVDFAVKCAQIIADTAVAAMKAYNQLGIFGAPAAALITATGLVQLGIAKKQRDAVKNLQPKMSASKSGQPAKAERVLTGFSDGGYTGRRRPLRGGRRGAPWRVCGAEADHGQPEGDRRRGHYRGHTPPQADRGRAWPVASQSSAGFADGGYTGGTVSATEAAEIANAVRELKAVCLALRSIRAYVVYSDIEQARDTLDRARAPFTRK